MGSHLRQAFRRRQAYGGQDGGPNGGQGKQKLPFQFPAGQIWKLAAFLGTVHVNLRNDGLIDFDADSEAVQ